MARKAGKVIHQLKIWNEGTMKHEEFALRMVDANAGYLGSSRWEFRVEIEEPIAFIMQNKDADVVEKALVKALKQHWALKWERWYLVDTEYRFQSQWDNLSHPARHLNVSFDFVETATLTNGTKVHRIARDNEFDAAYMGRINNGWPMKEEGHSKHKQSWEKDDHIATQAMLPATPENFEKLKKMMEAIDALGRRLSDLLSHKKIALTLSSAIPLLPAPKDE